MVRWFWSNGSHVWKKEWLKHFENFIAVKFRDGKSVFAKDWEAINGQVFNPLRSQAMIFPAKSQATQDRKGLIVHDGDQNT